jgi:hypothetical protein
VTWLHSLRVVYLALLLAAAGGLVFLAVTRDV